MAAALDWRLLVLLNVFFLMLENKRFSVVCSKLLIVNELFMNVVNFTFDLWITVMCSLPFWGRGYLYQIAKESTKH